MELKTHSQRSESTTLIIHSVLEMRDEQEMVLRGCKARGKKTASRETLCVQPPGDMSSTDE
ncbi:hypothetical protein EYF80_011025 [Liparis tanakae]|uniref:Uncharacterized protein n=1 Tax=Liparis tanakae TaxID=230148 RepID=A0A4Z2ILX2_9TELE|nr:hypothetical protein EYF80_011025 [Liparis tanakae]